MSDYSYRWVSLVLAGQTDYNAIRRMAAQEPNKPRWEPCPLDEIPNDIPPPPHPDPEEAKNFTLYRMSATNLTRRNADLAFLNDALRDSTVLNAIANRNIRQHIAELRATGETVDESWVPPDIGEGNPEFRRKVEVAYAFLHSRGLA